MVSAHALYYNFIEIICIYDNMFTLCYGMFTTDYNPAVLLSDLLDSMSQEMMNDVLRNYSELDLRNVFDHL